MSLPRFLQITLDQQHSDVIHSDNNSATKITITWLLSDARLDYVGQ